AVTALVAVGVGVAAQHPAPPQPPAAVGVVAAGPELPVHQRRNSPAPASPTPARPDAAGHREPAAPRAPAALDYSRPVRVSIPRINVSSTLVDLGLDPEGVMETPQDPAKAGWFTPSPPPGIPGASVIAGHVTWDQQPAVFFRLGDLRRGDKVRVSRADGSTAVFAVYRLGQFPKNAFPTKAVYRHTDQPELRLITCGGLYNEETNSYRANLIVWARMVSQQHTHR
ncbi:MAG: class F sortase, partial [Pseudonocardiaceae bacterium]